MATTKNTKGREYKNGVGTSKDLRLLIVQEILEHGGNRETGDVPNGIFTIVADKFRVSSMTSSKLWKRYVSNGNVQETPRHLNGRPKLTPPDVNIIKFFKKESPTMTGKEIQDRIKRYSPVSGDISVQTIYRTLSKELNYTYKRVSRPKGIRFTQYNMLFTQAYIDFCQRKTTRQLKFMDESGFKITFSDRNYGHSKKGERCIEIGRNLAGRNLTLNLLVGSDCVLYFNFVDGPSNTETYLNFWHEASLSQDDFGRPVFFPGDVVIVDNCSIHQNRAERVLTQFFGQQNVEYTFLPTYSPDLNPVENCFGKIKKIPTQERFREIAANNLKLAIVYAIKEIQQSDLINFFKHTGYINI